MLSLAFITALKGLLFTLMAAALVIVLREGP